MSDLEIFRANVRAAVSLGIITPGCGFNLVSMRERMDERLIELGVRE